MIVSTEALTPVVSRGSAWARRALALAGWRVDFVPPPTPKCLVIVYPHTSNWDFIIGVFARKVMGLRAQFVGKDSLFRFPLGPLMRWLGGIPVDRSQRTGLTGQLADELRRRPALCLALAPEGTRGRAPRWRSGFYHVALAAGVPVGLGFIDYRTRVIGITRWERMSGDLERDLALVRAFYADKVGKYPEQASTIEFGRAEVPRRSG